MTSRGSSGDDRPRLTRRELLQGRLGKLLLGRSDNSVIFQRMPDAASGSASTAAARRSAPGDTDGPEVRTIQGISIEPVATTRIKSSVRSRQVPLFRPPGAVDETSFLQRCTGCGDCVEACPHGALIPRPRPDGGQSMAPEIDADLQACLMCEDFPCIAACTTSALMEQAGFVIGTARITKQLCLVQSGKSCTVCYDVCPEEGAVQLCAGTPTIDEDVCSGCGKCRQACPAPENAILLTPVFHRKRVAIANPNPE